MPPDDNAPSHVNGTGLKEGSASKGHKTYDAGSASENPCDFMRRGFCFTTLLEHVEFYCQRKGFCNETDHYTG